MENISKLKCHLSASHKHLWIWQSWRKHVCNHRESSLLSQELHLLRSLQHVYDQQRASLHGTSVEGAPPVSERTYSEQTYSADTQKSQLDKPYRAVDQHVGTWLLFTSWTNHVATWLVFQSIFRPFSLQLVSRSTADIFIAWAQRQ